MAALPVYDLVEGSGDYTAFTAVSASDTIANKPGHTFLAVNNQSGGNCTVGSAAVEAATTKPGFGNLTKANVSVVVPTGRIAIIGPFAKALTSSAGNVTVTFSATSSVTARAFNMPNLDGIV